MLRRLTWPQLREWMDYDTLEPIGEQRGDWQAAAISAAIANVLIRVNRGTKVFKVSDFLLEFDEKEKAASEAQAPPKDDWKRLKFIAQMFCADSDARERKKRG